MSKKNKQPKPNPGRSTVAVLLRLDPSLIAWLDEIGKQTGMSKPATIEHAMESLREAYQDMSKSGPEWDFYARFLLGELSRAGLVNPAAIADMRQELRDALEAMRASRREKAGEA